jgi:methylated-DNA-[protein]-cysteine S-methyltransferase
MTPAACQTTLDSPVGPLTLVARGGRLVEIRFPDGRRAAEPPAGAVAAGASRAGTVAAGASRAGTVVDGAPPAGAADDEAALTAAVRQLGEYFGGDRTAFDLDLAPQGTAFERRVWEELLAIPYGETRSYGEIARAIGRPEAARAVGAANGRNPIPIVIPCHRVLGASGALTGFGGGLDTKRWLLEHERQRSLFSTPAEPAER